jgi:alpha-L-glutamate ligase-like protein
MYTKFKTPQDLYNFDFTKLPDAFALKPSRGLGGEGIIVVKKRATNGMTRDKQNGKNLGNGKTKNLGVWITTQKTKVNIDDLKLHILDIMEGAYSMGNIPDVAFIQEYVGRHNAFRKYAYRGTPDIRIIVFNKVPVLAMLRLPTKESGGRANLHQGAIAVGVDMATGITTRAIWHGEQIHLKPGTNRKLHGIKIPNWTSMLELAVKTQMASGLGYLGVDIVLHPEKGPMILEINAQPGLQIQLANKVALKRRLDRIEDLDVIDPEHGVKIAKALFAGRFTDRVRAEEGIKIVNVWELVKVASSEKKKINVVAKIDTGAWRTSIDRNLAKTLGLMHPNNILLSKSVKSGLGKEERWVIYLTYYLAGRKIRTLASLSNRENLRTRLIIGRRDLDGFLMKTDESELKTHKWYTGLWKNGNKKHGIQHKIKIS